MTSVVTAWDRLLQVGFLLMFARGCCVGEHDVKEDLTWGDYVPREGSDSPLPDLTLFVGEDDTVRFEYDMNGELVVVDYEVTSRRYADEEKD